MAATTEVYTPDRLFAGDFPRATDSVTIITGQNLTRGALLGKITASGKYNLSLSTAVDGSEVPEAILLEDVDATAADKVAPVALTGEFNEDSIVYGTGHTKSSVKAGLRDKGIFLKTPVSA